MNLADCSGENDDQFDTENKDKTKQKEAYAGFL